MTTPLGDNEELAHDLAAAHSITAHLDEYIWFVPRDNVPVLSLLEQIELAFYTDYSMEAWL